MDFASLRKEYSTKPLHLKDLDSNPFKQLESWLKVAQDSELLEPNAMALSTVSIDNTPSTRTVLLKELTHEGLIFYTNTSSEKAQDIAANPNVSLLFLWIPLERQIRINGVASPLPRAKSEQYFQSRPIGSQLAAWASPQSQPIESYETLNQRLNDTKERFKDQSPLPLPPHWGGYLVKPYAFEFWQGARDRLHHRFHYQKQQNDWKIQRLAP